MGGKRSQKWRQRYLNAFDNLIANPEFYEDVSLLADLNGDELYDATLELYKKYQVPGALWDFIRHFAKNDKERKIELIKPSAMIVSDYDQVLYPADDPKIAYQIYKQTLLVSDKEVKIVLNSETTKAELDDLLSEYLDAMKQLIPSKQGRIRKKPMEERDQFIVELSNSEHTKEEIISILARSKDYADTPFTIKDIQRIIDRKKRLN